MVTPKPETVAILNEFGLRFADGNRYPEIGETRAIATLERIARKYGADHLRMVLTTLAETANNKALLDEVGLWMASDMVLVSDTVINANASEWLSVWDRMPVGELQFITRDLAGIIPQRYALGGMVYERLVRAFGPLSKQSDLFDDRREP